jgi:hypothetical protein
MGKPYTLWRPLVPLRLNIRSKKQRFCVSHNSSVDCDRSGMGCVASGPALPPWRTNSVRRTWLLRLDNWNSGERTHLGEKDIRSVARYTMLVGVGDGSSPEVKTLIAVIS